MEESAPVIEIAAKNELDELKDKHLRLQAEYANFQKRKAREADEIRQYAAVGFVEKMLSVLDHFQLALDPSHDRTDPNWSAGIDLIAKEMFETLRSFGLEELDVKRGDAFNHDLHDAIAHAPGESPGKVLEIAKKGYRLRDRVIRHAQVVVSSESQS